MKQYVALIHKEVDTDYGVMFPDFPGCISVGETYEEALRFGAEALGGHVEAMRQDGDVIPEPRTVEEIKDAAEDWVDFEESVVALIPLLPAPGRTVRVNVTLDERLLAEIDAVTTNRSAFLADAARVRLQG